MNVVKNEMHLYCENLQKILKIASPHNIKLYQSQICHNITHNKHLNANNVCMFCGFHDDMCECEHWSSDSDEEDEELQLSHCQYHQ